MQRNRDLNGPESPAKRRYRKSQQPRWWRTRKDPFALVTDEIDERLSRTPNASAKDILGELQQRYPGVFLDNLLRTLQRRVKVWRLAQVSVDAQNRDEEIRLNRDTARWQDREPCQAIPRKSSTVVEEERCIAECEIGPIAVDWSVRIALSRS